MPGIKIKMYLDKNGIKQSFVCEKAGLKPQVMSDIVSGRRKIEATEYFRICKAIGVPLDYFFEEVHEEPSGKE